MRAAIYALLLATLMLLAPVALADGGKGRSAEHDDDDDHADKAAKATERRAREHDRLVNLSSEYDNHTASRLAFLDGMIAKLQGMRASYAENSTRIKAECAPLWKENATKDERKDFKECLREGHKEWRTERRAETKALRQDMLELFHSLRHAHRAD